MVNWVQFELKNYQKESKVFEDLCRKLFKKRFPEVSLWPNANPNNPGIEMPPVFDPNSGKNVGFQAKYIKFDTNNDTFYRELEKSVDQTIYYYVDEAESKNRPRITEFYFYCNRTVSTERTAYERVTNKMSAKGIRIILVCNEVILDDVECDLLLKNDYFSMKSDPNEIPRISRKYLQRFEEPLFDNKPISLADTYVYNSYSFQDGIIREDLEQVIKHFRKGNLEEYLHIESLISDISLLFIKGMQCTGKSALVGKIIYDHYHLSDNIDRIHVINFDDRASRRQKIGISFLKEKLGISEDDIENSLIIIDGIDESECSISELHDDIEQLIADMEGYNCKAIMTCRNNLLDITDLDGCLSFELQQLSIQQATIWIERCCLTSDQEENAMQFIEQLKEEYHSFILRPYILRMCIQKGILDTHPKELGQLYDAAFTSNKSITYSSIYDDHKRMVPSDYRIMLDTITDIALLCVTSSDNSISKDELKQMSEERNCRYEKLITEFFLVEGQDCFYFVHHSIALFFASRYIYKEAEKIALSYDADSFNIYVQRLVDQKIMVSDTMMEFLEYFARTSKDFVPNRWIQLLKGLLTNGFTTKINGTINLIFIKQYYHSAFLLILKIVIAVLNSRSNHSEIDLFSYFSEEEIQLLAEYSRYGISKIDELRLIRFRNISINHFNFSSCILCGKKLLDMVARMALFQEAWLSGTYFIHSDFSLSLFIKSRCVNSIFFDCMMNGCNFSEANLNGARFEKTSLVDADLRTASVAKTKFVECNLYGLKINAEQLKDLVEFDIPFIRKNKIKVFRNDCELPDMLLEDEMQKQRPVEYAMYRYSIQKKQRNPKA